MNTYDKALKEYKKWRGLRSSFGLDDKINTIDKELIEWVNQLNNPNKGCIYSPLKIIVNGPATIVFWKDGTKTVVKCAKGESWDIYNAFTAALTIKIFGSNSKIKKILKTKVEWPDDFTLDVKED